MPQRSNARWSPDEDERLRTLLVEGKSLTRISLIFKRSVLAIKSRAIVLGISSRPSHRKIEPTPDLPDDTPIDQVRFPARITNVLNEAGLKSIGEIRETGDATFAYLRKNLGPAK